MKRVLFVDDEPHILDGLRRMLRPLRDEWSMVFADSGQSAINLLRTETFDVVVSDMRMPDADGVKVMEVALETQPHTVRIILSGQADRESVLKIVGKTHQFLTKPCDGDVLKNTITRACAVRELLTDDKAGAFASKLETIPAMPSACEEILNELSSTQCSLQRVSGIIARDMAMSTKVLQLVNSSFFGLGKQVTSPTRAVIILGTETIRALALTHGLFHRISEKQLAALGLQGLWDHSARTGSFARRIARSENVCHFADTAFLSGFLHPIGELLFASQFEQEYMACKQKAAEQGIADWQAQEEALGTSSGPMGAYLLGLWGLPLSIIEAVAWSHWPSIRPVNAFSGLTAVHIANALDAEANCSAEAECRIDLVHLETIGMADHLPHWRDLYRESCDLSDAA